MLIAFGIENFRSFGTRQELTFLASNDRFHEERLVQEMGLRISRVSALYGANASGKSNLIAAIAAAESFVLDSATRMNQGDLIPAMEPHRLDDRFLGEPCRFDFSLLLSGVRYHYSFACDSKRVFEESLYSIRPGGRSRCLFRRELDPVDASVTWSFPALPAADAKLLKTKTRENCLVLSRGAELNIELFGELYRWFKDGVHTVDNTDRPGHFMIGTAKAIQDSEVNRSRILRLFRDADLGIHDLRVVERPATLPENAPNELREMFEHLVAKKQGGLFELTVKTYHTSTAGDLVEFDLERDESNGTKRWFGLIGFLSAALDHGWMVVVDELDCSLHPILTDRIVAMFADPEANPKGAQLIFSTHDTTLMKPALLRRDQIWMVEKTAAGQSELFSLYDFPRDDRPRKQDPWSKHYLSGKYGAVPNPGLSLEGFDRS